MQNDIDRALRMLRGAKAALFDFNGTLSLDEDMLETAYGEALVRLGEEPLRPGEYASLLGHSEYDICSALVASRPTQLSTTRLLEEVTREYLEACAAQHPIPTPHRDLVCALTAEGVRCAVVTGTIPAMVSPVLREAGFDDLLSCVVTAEDVVRGKPSPDGFLKARSLLNLDKRDAVVVLEDSQAGVTAAVRAAMTPIAVRPGIDGAAATVPSLTAIANAWMNSPRIDADAHNI